MWWCSLLGESKYINSNTNILFQMEKVFLLRLHISVYWNYLDRISPLKSEHLHFVLLCASGSSARSCSGVRLSQALLNFLKYNQTGSLFWWSPYFQLADLGEDSCMSMKRWHWLQIKIQSWNWKWKRNTMPCLNKNMLCWSHRMKHSVWITILSTRVKASLDFL